MSERDSICVSEQNPDSKRCARCGCTKEFSNFYRNKGTSDGYGSWCRDCERARDRGGYVDAYRQTESYVLAQRKYRESSRGKKTIAEYTRELPERPTPPRWPPERPSIQQSGTGRLFRHLSARAAMHP